MVASQLAAPAVVFIHTPEGCFQHQGSTSVPAQKLGIPPASSSGSSAIGLGSA